MKKLLFVFLLGAFVACNDSASTAEDKNDSMASSMDSTTDAKTDSMENKTDSMVNKMDSTTDAKTDSLKK